MLSLLKSLMGVRSHDRESFATMVNEARFPSEIATVLLRDFSRSERAEVEAIESLRLRTEKDRREVTLLDYGAGSGLDHRTPEQMAAGVPTTRIIGEVCAVASKSAPWGEMLFKLIRHQRPLTCIEMGTCLGISAAYIATALRANGQGRLVTLEGADAYAEVARANLHSLGLDNTIVEVGKFSDTLAPALEAMKPVEFMFIDGHHDRDATLHYLETSRAFLAQKNVVVFDDIDWSDGMREAWASIKRATTGFGLGNVGVCLNVS
jgi:Methyltransferase domain